MARNREKEFKRICKNCIRLACASGYFAAVNGLSPKEAEKTYAPYFQGNLTRNLKKAGFLFNP
jgi:hypothetical protein